ncbi:MAG: serine hydrolase [Cumulibacter sp.]
MPKFARAHRPSPLYRAFVAGAVASVLLLGGFASPASAAPTSSNPTSSGAPPTPSIDAAAPTPTSAKSNGKLQGHAPDGSTIGGSELSTRDIVTYDGAPALPKKITAHGWLVADLGTGEVLAAKDPHGLYYPASTLKTLTFLALYPQLDPADVLTATHEDASVEGSRVGIVEDGKYSVGQLWSALILQSGNDAARMLTRAAGGPETALGLMEDKAAQLHAYDTHPGTTSGLDVAGQSSSPYDLALFMREIVQDPTLRKIAGAKLGKLPAQPPDYPQPLTYGNQNQLVLEYSGAIAGKNGFTDAARNTFVAAAERGGRTLVVSLMRAEQTPQPTWMQAAALLDWAFDAPDSTSGAGRLITPDEVSLTTADPSTSAVASGQAAGSRAPSLAQNSASSDSQQHTGTFWPLIAVLGGLLLVAVRVAAPRHPRR